MRIEGKAQESIERILSAARNGQLPEAVKRVVLDAGGKHCDRYSFLNRLIVDLFGYTDAAGFKQWKADYGRQVKGGEHGFAILAPAGWVTRKRVKSNGEVVDDKFPTKFVSVTVFGLEQTEVSDADKWAAYNAKRAEAEKFMNQLPLVNVARHWGMTLSPYNGEHTSHNGWYSRTENAIGLGVQNYATWAHELVHKADDKLGNLKERGQHWRSETVAELGGAALLLALGYEREADTGGCWDYISKYATTANITPEAAIMDVMTRTQKAVALILETAEKLNDEAADTIEAEAANI